MYPSRDVTFITAIMNSFVLYVNWSIEVSPWSVQWPEFSLSLSIYIYIKRMKNRKEVHGRGGES